ncbi:ABC1 kinase family protein [Nitrincola tapanii]|uniref:AarF/ABC1/UbiB kinase family protein n=1 Tax=Nitrincola tapanii TaxID=1708751 RepID=A0A5A9W866_9GAMM|nr:AarF/ABC1/UbiB kinase family protein [Nitrincola tapanii]KAA0876308.1 AarF/ABC1/UbiB kinase family protein [Nitrincola tapanii]
MTDKSARSVPAHRLSRLAHLGGLATRVAGGVVAEGVRQLAKGQRPEAKDLLLTPANLRRVADKLAHLRGAAMKLGQLLSMDAGDLMPVELAELLAGLRSGATPMPMLQLAAVMEQNLGSDWQTHFQQFSFSPLAAASIGQVHQAIDRQGNQLALKIQYPGVRQSIDSDVDNVVSLLKLSRLLPPELPLQELIEEAKRQLHAEADYRLEAEHLQAYHQHLNHREEIRVPQFYPALSGETLLCMSYESGAALDQLIYQARPERQRIAALLLELLMQELFVFGRVQTDPNFANFLYDPASRDLVLLDFGATRLYSPHWTQAYRAIFRAGIAQDRDALLEAATQIGYFKREITSAQQTQVLSLFELAMEPLRAETYDFAATDLARRLRDQGMELSLRQGYWHSPPIDALFLHRKLAGLYLLFARLGVSLPCRALVEPWLAD